MNWVQVSGYLPEDSKRVVLYTESGNFKVGFLQNMKWVIDDGCRELRLEGRQHWAYIPPLPEGVNNVD